MTKIAVSAEGTFNQLMARVAVNKSLLKEFETSDGRTVYLNDGDEFQIQLYNPSSEEIAAGIWLNNEEFPNIIIIRPGERIWLERYLNKPNKFKFTTYSVDNNSETEKAISYNGDIKIEFYKKEKYNFWDTLKINNDYISTCCSDNYRTYDTLLNSKCVDTCPSALNHLDTPISGSSYCNVNSTFSTGSDTVENSVPSFSNNLKRCKSVSNTIDAMLTTSFNSTLDFEDIALSASADTIETGRISEGGHSNQKFDYTNDKYCNYSFKTEHIKILPMSRKPYTANDLEKIYCPECGRKLKSKFKYCPYCGTKL